MNNINSKRTTPLGFSIPAGMVSMWAGPWWFGNLKGLMLGGNDGNLSWLDISGSDDCLQASHPSNSPPYNKMFGMFDISGGTGGKASSWNDIYNDIMPMTYDMGGGCLANECGQGPKASIVSGPPMCNLAGQVQWYLEKSWFQYGVNVHIGFEVGRPAFPHASDTNTKGDGQLPLTTNDANSLINYATTQKNIVGAFYWEMFKDIVTSSKDGECVSYKQDASISQTTIDTITGGDGNTWTCRAEGCNGPAPTSSGVAEGGGDPSACNTTDSKGLCCNAYAVASTGNVNNDKTKGSYPTTQITGNELAVNIAQMISNSKTTWPAHMPDYKAQIEKLRQNQINNLDGSGSPPPPNLYNIGPIANYNNCTCDFYESCIKGPNANLFGGKNKYTNYKGKWGQGPNQQALANQMFAEEAEQK